MSPSSRFVVLIVALCAPFAGALLGVLTAWLRFRFTAPAERVDESPILQRPSSRRSNEAGGGVAAPP